MTDIDLGYAPRVWQDECAGDRARFRVIALHRRGGKTVYATMELIDAAMRTKHTAALFVFIAPLLSQAKDIAWGMLKLRLLPLIEHKAVKINEAELSVTFAHNGAVIRLYGADNPDKMRGLRVDGCVIDEVAQIKKEVWEDILLPALSDRQGFAIFIGTPNGINLFSELFYKGRTKADWSSRVYTVHETGVYTQEAIDTLRADMPETSFKREYLCDFGASGEDQLISLDSVSEACKRVYKLGEFDYAPRILGVDPARFGDDSSVIIKRQGLQIFEPIQFHGIDNMALADQVAYHIAHWQPDAVFIDAGNGSGVIDRCRQLGHSVIEVAFGGKSANPAYANKRAEMWFAMRDWLQEGGSIPDHARLKQDLATPIYWHDKMGRKLIEPKDDIKARGLPSSDYADAACLTFASPVVKREAVARGQTPKHVADYDPLDRQRVRQECGGKR